MSKRTLFRFFALLLCLTILLPCIAACSEEPVDDAEPTDTEESVSGSDASGDDLTPEEGTVIEPVLRDDCWYIAYKNTTTYSLVRSEDAMNLVKAKVLELQENIKKWTAADPLADIDPETDHLLGEDAGADVALIENAAKLTNQEIVIGQIGLIGRPDIEEYAKTVKGITSGGDFFIEVRENGDVWIIGGSNTATSVAADFAFNRVFDVNQAERYICVEKGYNYTYHHADKNPDAVITRQTDTALEFTYEPNSMIDVFARLTYSARGGWRLQNKYSHTKDFEDMGASQLISLAMGELPNVEKEKLTYETVEEGAVKITAPDGSYALLTTDPFLLEFYTPSGVLAQTVKSLRYSMEYGAVNVGVVKLALNFREPIYGSGQRFDDVNLYGKSLVLYSTDVWDNLFTTDSASQSQVTIPFFTNMHGSGVFMNRNEYMVADVGATNPRELSFTISNGLIDLYIYTTESIPDAISKYCETSGANEIPEDWTYGMINCRAYPDFSDLNKTFKIIAKMEEYSLPWNGVVVQGWSTYDESMHADLERLCAYVHSLGKKVIVYVAVGDFPGAVELDAILTEEKITKPEFPTPNYFMTYRSSSNKEHLAGLDENGKNIYDKKIPNCDAQLLAIQMLDSEAIQANDSAKAYYYLDLTDDEAVEWFFEEYWEYLLHDVGVDGAKIDLGFMLPDTAGTLTMDDGAMTTAGSHHWYATAFAAKLWKKISEKPDSGIALVCGGGIGSQRLSYVSGVNQSRDYNRLQRQLTAMLSSGLSGMAFTAFDIGGSSYRFEPLNAKQDAIIFLRSVQMAAFSPAMQTAGSGSAIKLPYEYAEYEDEEGNRPYAYVTELYRAYSMLHDALTPYIAECAKEANETGMPLVRHLVLHYANDTKVYSMKDQYMLGKAFLVAPMLPTAPDENGSRDIYLPEGKWLDMLTGETYEVSSAGQTLSGYAVSKSLIPVFYNLNDTSDTALEAKENVQTMLDYIKTIK